MPPSAIATSRWPTITCGKNDGPNAPSQCAKRPRYQHGYTNAHAVGADGYLRGGTPRRRRFSAQKWLTLEKGNTNEALAFIYNQMGTLFHYQNGVDTATHYYIQSEKVYNRLQDTLGMLRPLYNRAILAYSNGLPQKALESYLRIAIQEAKGMLTDLILTYGAISSTSV
ncbi:MAG: hypothetical protein R2795_25990 [Saprospiraceae bacterium]